MSIHRSRRLLRNLAVVGATAMLSSAAFATVESSCPAPCTTLPKSALFVRETAGVLGQGGFLPPLEGTLRVGTRKTVLRVDASVTVEVDASVNGYYIDAYINGRDLSSSKGYVPSFTTCDNTRSYLCSVTGTFWFDIDAHEAAFPGEFVGKPVTITLTGGNLHANGNGRPYQASFSAEVVKKK
jgi:hypothetical protein